MDYLSLSWILMKERSRVDGLVEEEDKEPLIKSSTLHWSCSVAQERIIILEGEALGSCHYFLLGECLRKPLMPC